MAKGSDVSRTEYGGRAGSTRSNLLGAARDQFAAKGFVGARLTDIAAAASMTTGAYYRHFATKVDIFDVLFEEFIDELSSALVDVSDLEEFCRTWLLVHEAHLGTVRAAEDVTPKEPRLWAHRRRLRKLWASSALRHLHLVRDSKHRRTLSLVLVDTLDYYFFTRIRGWATGTVESAAFNLALLFSEGLYGDDVSRRAEPKSPSGSPRTPKNPAPCKREAAMAPLVHWGPSPGRTEPTSQRGQSQREAVLRSAAHVLTAAGYENATIPQIAAHAGVSAGTVYRYFADKRDVFMCLLSRAERSVIEKSIWPLGPDGRLEVRQAALTYLGTRQRESAVYRVWRELLDCDEEMERLWIDTRRDFQVAISRVVRRSQDDGLITARFDPPIAAELLVALFDGPAHAWFDLGWAENGDISEDELAAVLAARIGDE